KAATGVIAGLGVRGYRLALSSVAELLEEQA
ncbi:3-dehydroquinate dehydratase, partial [Pseudomonas sp. OA3]|nr:3-dehydroquinate dehydratase [Pseudomonas sp. OA3]